MKYLSKIGIGLILVALVAATVGTVRYFRNNEKIAAGEISYPEEWLVFTDPIAGYSLHYPPDSYLQGGPESETKYSFVFLTINHDEGQEIIEIHTLDNSEELSLDKFIQTKQALKYAKPTDSWRKADLNSETSSLQIAGRQALLVKQSEATFPLTGLCQQVTYIHYGSRVIAATLCPAKRGVWELGYRAKPAGEELYFQVLNTFTRL